MDISSYNFDYLQPPSQVNKITHNAGYIKSGTGKNAQRKIFHNVKFDDFEKGIANTFENSLQDKGIKLPLSWNINETLRYLYAAEFDFATATSMVQYCLKWREDPKSSTLTKEVLQLLSSGVIYIWGHDFEYRPNLIINMNKIDPREANEDTFKSALSICMDILRSYCFVGGKVESWNIILDIQNSPLIDLIEPIVSHVQCCFPQTLEKMFIVNISDKQRKIAENMVHQNLNKSVFLLKNNEVFKITTYLDSSCLEVKYGGKCPTLQKYWPPPDHSGKSNDSRILPRNSRGESTPSSLSDHSQKRPMMFSANSITDQPQISNDPNFKAERFKPLPKKQLAQSPETKKSGRDGYNNQNRRRVSEIPGLKYDDPDDELVRGLLFKEASPDKQFRKTFSDRRILHQPNINDSPPNKLRKMQEQRSHSDLKTTPVSSEIPDLHTTQETVKRSNLPSRNDFGWEFVQPGRDSLGSQGSPKKSVTFKSEILENGGETPRSSSPTQKSNLRTASKFTITPKEVKEDQPKRRLIELPREKSVDENDTDSDDSGYFCGICVSSKAKAKTKRKSYL